MNTVDKFVKLIEETSHKAYVIKGGGPVKSVERKLQEYIIMRARSLGYRAFCEDILKIWVHNQPLIDVVVDIDGYLHAAELKIMDVKKFQYFEGLSQVLAYSLYGVDFLWLIHYLTGSLLGLDAAKWSKWFSLEDIFQVFGIKQVGYLLIDTTGLKFKITPTEPIKHSEHGKELRKKLEEILMLSDM